MSPDDFIITLSVNDLDYLRTALRNESARLRQQGFDGLRAHTDNLRDKISNQMIEQAQARIDNKATPIINSSMLPPLSLDYLASDYQAKG